ncbi:MAG: methyltransferase, partial [Verrucomicrobia bacterium]|nr:methyltransferase [Verrucomicrobiota bacterium]
LKLARSVRSDGCQSALDMGCGCGFQAIVLAMLGVKTVFAVDIDKRCVAATEFNALLNNVSEWTSAKHSVTALHGDMFEPMEGQKFDLIVSNPPTLPHSDETPYYADGGKDGRDFLDRLIEHSSQHLHDHGKLCFIQSTGKWIFIRDQQTNPRSLQAVLLSSPVLLPKTAH